MTLGIKHHKLHPPPLPLKKCNSMNLSTPLLRLKVQSNQTVQIYLHANCEGSGL